MRKVLLTACAIAAATPAAIGAQPPARPWYKQPWDAASYFDALTGDDGAISAFADGCVRHENGYQTVNNATPGRAAPSPALPDTSTPIGRAFSQLSMTTARGGPVTCRICPTCRRSAAWA